MPSKKSTKTKSDVGASPNITFTIQPAPAFLGSKAVVSKTRPPSSEATTERLLAEERSSGNKKRDMSGQSTDTSSRTNRKSKGGKLVLKSEEEQETIQPIANVILHLRCTMADLTEYTTKMNRMVKNELIYNPDIPPEIHTYTPDTMDFANYNTPTSGGATSCSSYTLCNDMESKLQNETDQIDIAYSDNSLMFSSNKTSGVSNTPYNLCRVCCTQIENEQINDDPNVNMKDINIKLKNLKINLYKNTLQDKKSACFWCSYDFDNQPCYIPKYETDDKIYGYGSFCRPECAVAYLMKENLDDSTKFERYHLLNHIYSKVYGYKKNIKPAPSPFYLLEKYFGNLSIQEYRKLLSTEHLLTVIEKPMSRILPELFEDNDHFILGVYGNNSKPSNQKNVYKVKRQSEKTAAQTPSKNVIMKEQFGLA